MAKPKNWPKYYSVRKGRGYWLPTKKMKKAGFANIRCGPDGPEAWRIAYEWDQRWQDYRRGILPDSAKIYPRDSVGDAFERYRKTTSWSTRGPRTREDWERGWKYVEPVFGDQPPAAITFEILDDWYHALLRKHGVDIAYRAMKTWRALYTVMAGMRLCPAGQDPSRAIRRQTPRGRSAVWLEGEVARLVKGAWRAGYKGLACIVAVAWDTSFAPVDARSLTPAHAVPFGTSWGFQISRTKTGEAAFGTLSIRTQRLITAYVDSLGVTLLDDAPIFRTRGHAPGPKGGRPRAGVPYTKNRLSEDFADVRALVFGDGEKRMLMDLRRSGAVEANAGGGSVEALAAKMGNSIDRNKALQKVYMPVNLVAVLSIDEARRKGRVKLASERNENKKLKLGSEKS